ncbi:uncharacterized protein LOC131682069 [Topomyia yanbarensis]|uniref:uncharacterized protein LOC131682069 n=1 Tax=Topomyia yanbarensis TaxID=2498891 RepID=UPI00273B48C2|nr:uncharacterized protein LOC131682069 [Topomyia yanbarensis]XP_058819243.1 uncharacterized protein LOC131682069 [Topomyia yanbarensis]
MNLNFLLTEISLQLLDNKFFDMHGQETDNMKDFFAAQNASLQKNGQKRLKTSGELLPLLGIASFDDLKNCSHYVDNQYQGFIDNLQARIEIMPQVDESTPTSSNRTHAQMQSELCEVRIKTQREYAKMVSHSKKMMDIYLDTLPQEADRDWESTKYIEEERSLLVNEFNSLLYFLKRVLADVKRREQCEQAMEIIKGTKETLKHL